VVTALAVHALLPSVASGQTAENVAVVINDNSPVSQKIGDYYARRRGIPPSNIIRIRTSTNETLDPPRYAATIEAPIAAALSRERLQDRVLYLVLTKDVPLRIEGTGGTQGTISSVDSELTLLYRRMSGQPTVTIGRVDNPYFLGARAIADAQPFTHRDHDIYLVTRLDGFTADDAIALIDRAIAPSTDGRIVLDQQDRLVNRTGEDWLEAAAERLQAQGHGDRVLLEKTVEGVRGVAPVIGYYSWGSNDPRNRARTFKLGFVPGAIAGMFVSSDARTFREPPAEWLPTGDVDRTKWFAGTPQSLIGDLIREGVTGVAGHVSEPFLQSTARPEILFPAYMAGFNVAEAFYLATPHLSWQNIIVGDPLCAPFRQRVLTRTDIDDAIDPETQFPKLFSERRVAALQKTVAAASEAAVRLVARAEALVIRGDRAGARTTLEEASRAAPKAPYIHLQLGLVYDQERDHNAAAESYRRVIELQPQNVVALNNLAYILVTHRKAPAEALPFAERAAALAPLNGAVLDTLAWIEHLLGNRAAASRRISLAVQTAPNNAEIRLRAAIIYAANGARSLAESELQQVLKLDPTLNDSEEVKQLRGDLAKLSGGTAP
jgi:uncharacterized protein (TIGR03790 family)